MSPRKKKKKQRPAKVPEPAKELEPAIVPEPVPATKQKPRFIDPVDLGCIIFLILLVGGSGYLVLLGVRYYGRGTKIKELYRQSWELAHETAAEPGGSGSTDYQTPEAFIQGKVLVIDIREKDYYGNIRTVDEYGRAFDYNTEALPSELRPEIAEDVGTIVAENCARKNSYEYDCVTEGTQRRRPSEIETCKVKVINRASRRVMASKTFSSEPFCASSLVSNKIHTYLLNLPRK